VIDKTVVTTKAKPWIKWVWCAASVGVGRIVAKACCWVTTVDVARSAGYFTCLPDSTAHRDRGWLGILTLVENLVFNTTLESEEFAASHSGSNDQRKEQGVNENHGSDWANRRSKNFFDF